MEQESHLVPPKFVTFPIVYDPNFGDDASLDVTADPLWKKAAVTIVNDPEDKREKRLNELCNELKLRNIKLCPGDDNQLLAMLRAGQGQISRAIHVVEVFLQYQQYEKKGMYLKQNFTKKSVRLSFCSITSCFSLSSQC